MDTGIEILGFLIGASGLLFLLISALVLVPGRSSARAASTGAVWLGGPGHSERGVSTAGLVLAGKRASWAATPDADWTALAETAEPGRQVGGASAGW
ncbi:hypothetical protein [Thermoactinospora rubra]|uniref:hypothetical protein n=1 Tax=Thermoactinospora rubra TaxID=1088767 RepID=UPI000A10460E|nr:hypothetical protein [Thermoactinospora rubra]